MPNTKEIAKIKKKAKKGESVNKIKKDLELPKSTVYYHFKKEVGQKQKEKALTIPENEEVKGELCGIFAGDGNFYKKETQQYRIRFYFNFYEEYHEVLADFLEDVLERRPRIYKYPNQGRVELDYSSKKFYNFLKENLEWKKDKTENICLKNPKNLSKDFKKGFARGLLDTDGHREKKFRRFIYGTISRDLRNNFSSLVRELDIEATDYSEEPENDNWRTMYKTRITGDAAQKFQKKIRPRNPKKNYSISELNLSSKPCKNV